MATIAELKNQGHLPANELEEVIERAARLQERANANANLSVAEIKSVGQELDIDPRFIDAALAELRSEREQAGQAAARARARFRKSLLVAGGAAALLGLLAWSASGRVGAARADTDLARTALLAVQDRQAALFPQLLALAGGAAAELEPQRRNLERATDQASRTTALHELQAAMVTLLARLPPANDPSQAQMRLSLHHELAGAQNRITVESRRYEEALATWRSAARTPTGRLAVAFRLASAPP